MILLGFPTTGSLENWRSDNQNGLFTFILVNKNMYAIKNYNVNGVVQIRDKGLDEQHIGIFICLCQVSKADFL